MNELRLYFVKNNTYLSILIFLIACFVQILLYLKMGSAHPSTDFSVIYEPHAIEFTNWLKGEANAPNLQGYTISHSLYIIYIALIYTIFGIEARNIAVIIQILLYAISTVFIYHLLKRILTLKLLPLLIIIYSLIFFDNIQWAAWLLADNLYKPLFLTTLAIISNFYLDKKTSALVLSIISGTIILSLIRIDAIVQMIPFLYLLLSLNSDTTDISTTDNKLPNKKKFLSHFYLLGIAVILLIAILTLHQQLGNVIKAILKILYDKFKNGDIIVGLGYRIEGITHIEELEPARSRDILYLISRFIHLFILRIYNFLTIAPQFWSKTHKIYYAFNMLPIYIFSIIGFIKSIKQRNAVFTTFGLIFIATVILHGLTRVDGALRTMYTPLMILIMLAGYGIESLVLKYADKKLSYFKTV